MSNRTLHSQTLEPADLLAKVFETLDDAKIAYVVLHGYERFAESISSDVDIIIQPGVRPGGLVRLFHRNKDRIGAEVVRCAGGCIELARWGKTSSPRFLALDFATAAEVDGLHIMDGAEVLANRQRFKQFWVPPAAMEFGCYLARTIAKGRLDAARTQRLTSLYQQDPKACDAQIMRFWLSPEREQLTAAARSGDWAGVLNRQNDLRLGLRSTLMRRHPLRFALDKLQGLGQRLKRLAQPGGVNIAMLGPDGAGKSSVVDALGPALAAVFSRTVCWGFAVSPGKMLKRKITSTDQPHALPARSLPVSLIRAGFWFLYYTVGYLYVHLTKARSTLVINDRHFVDILIDQKRYRYGGPLWLLRLIWRVIPKPELIVLLDAPPEVLQMRKQEVAFEVTARQRNEYLSLVKTLENGHIVDASQPLQRVIDDTAGLVLSHLAHRVSVRFGLKTGS